MTVTPRGRRHPPFGPTESAGNLPYPLLCMGLFSRFCLQALRNSTPHIHVLIRTTLLPHFASPSDFSALPLSSSSAFMNSPYFAAS
jgi:hypothetical protein